MFFYSNRWKIEAQAQKIITSKANFTPFGFCDIKLLRKRKEKKKMLKREWKYKIIKILFVKECTYFELLSWQMYSRKCFTFLFYYLAKRRLHSLGQILLNLQIKSNLWTTTQNLWPLLTGGRYLEVFWVAKNWCWGFHMVVTLGRWSLAHVWLVWKLTNKN